MEQSGLGHIVGALVFLLLFSTMLWLGLGQSWPELLAFWRHPSLMLRSLVAIDVLVPLALFVVAAGLPGLERDVRFAIALMAATSTGPLSLRKVRKIHGAAAYGVSLQLTVAVLAIATAPLIVGLFSLGDLRVSPLEVARQVVQAQLSGLALGILIRHFWPTLADKLAHPVSLLANVLFFASLILLVIAPRILMSLDWLAFVAMGLCVVASLAIGHLLGGPRPDTRVVLAIIASTRNMGLALAIAGASLAEPLPVQAAIVAYMFVEQVIQIPYLVWRKRAAARRAQQTSSAPT
jgi:BASS family bile acid:Na+ symporter